MFKLLEGSKFSLQFLSYLKFIIFVRISYLLVDRVPVQPLNNQSNMNQTNGKQPRFPRVNLKLYTQDTVNVGFWMAISNDNWKTACVEKDDFQQQYSITVNITTLL